MNTYRYETELLGEHHDRAGFSCGVDALDRYLRRQAGQDQRRNLAVVYVLTDVAGTAVVAYYTLSTSSILPGSLTEATVRRLPRYERFPAILLGRLAVDQRHHAKGIGGLLLRDALLRCLESSRQIAAMAVVVDAKDDPARTFYEHFGFTRFANHEYGLYLPMTENHAL